MFQITKEWLSKVKLAEGILDAFFAIRVAASIEKIGENEGAKYGELYNACIEYVRNYCLERDTFTEEDLARIINGAKGAVLALDEYIYSEKELEQILSI